MKGFALLVGTLLGAALLYVTTAVGGQQAGPSRAEFNARWQKFLEKIADGDVAAIYFSGHGVEIEGLNYLLPRDVPYVTFGRQPLVQFQTLTSR